MSEPVADDGVLVVRRGPGANCSSIGSAVEMLFLSATVGTALLAAVSAALDPKDDDDDPDEPATAADAARDHRAGAPSATALATATAAAGAIGITSMGKAPPARRACPRPAPRGRCARGARRAPGPRAW